MNNQSITKNINLTNISDKKELENTANWVVEEMKNTGKTFAEVVGLDESFLEQGYSFAYTHYNAGQYKEALAIFDSLINYSGKTYKYVFGAAACIYQLKDYEAAALFFYAAMLLDQTNPFPIYYIAECAMKRNLKEEALTALDHTLELSENNSEFRALTERCSLLKNHLKNGG